MSSSNKNIISDIQSNISNRKTNSSSFHARNQVLSFIVFALLFWYVIHLVFATIHLGLNVWILRLVIYL